MDQQHFLTRLEFPLPQVSSGLGPHRRVPIQNGINLRSCELHHPRLTELLVELANSPEDVQFYPYLTVALDRIAGLIGISAERLTLAAGSDALISMVVDALGRMAGRIILQTPNYFGWSHYSALRNLYVKVVPTGVPHSTQMGFEELLTAASDSQPALVVISNPNSPTGHLLSEGELCKLASVCARHGHLLVVDECFAAFTPLNHFGLLGSNENVILIRSYSKSLGLAGARVAIAITSPRIARILSAYRTEGAVSGPAIHLLEGLLSRPAELETIWRDIVLSRETFQEHIAAHKPDWVTLPSAGNFLNIAVGENETPSDIVGRLQERGIYIKDTSSEIGLEGHVRFGIAHWSIMRGVFEAVLSL